MLNCLQLEKTDLNKDPFEWAFVDRLFAPPDAAAVAGSYPFDHFKLVRGNDGEKGYEYEVRSLISMGAQSPTDAEHLSPAWRQLAADLLSTEYRRAMSRLTNLNLEDLVIEANIFHYGPNDWMGPHLDLKEKVVTHVLYFNDSWNPADGGCLNILRSSTPSDVHAEVPPIVGNSVVLVRSDKSWHSVSRNVGASGRSRRSMTVTFYPKGCNSTMWPPGVTPELHDFKG
jgi:hypothetical protein